MLHQLADDVLPRRDSKKLARLVLYSTYHIAQFYSMYILYAVPGKAMRRP